MKRFLLFASLLAAGLVVLAAQEQASAIGRLGGGGGGARPAIGGGGARPAPAIAHTPSISPGAISRPNIQAAPKIQMPSPAMISAPAPRPAAKSHIQMPANLQRPTQLPKFDTGGLNLKPGGGAGGIQAKLPEFKNPGGGAGKIGDLKKQNPGLFNPGSKIGGGDRLPGSGKLPGNPGKDDINKWLGLPNSPVNRPGQGGTGEKLGIGDKIKGGGKIDIGNKGQDGDKIHNDFVNNWQKAANIGTKTDIKGGIKTGNIIKGGNKVGDINIDMSKNANFNNLSRHANVVNNNFRPIQHNWFNNQWWGGHPMRNAPWWHYHNYRPASWWWRPCTWGAFVGWFSAPSWSQPIYYDYGSNVVINQDVVYLNDQPVASAPVYAQQAIDLATVATPPPTDAPVEWLPLGTWAVSSKKDDDSPTTLLQLALSKDGLVSGTWYNRATDASSAVEGRVDPETQRVAIHKPDQPDVVMEVGVYNLTQAATPCLMHFGTLNTQTWYLLRLEDQEGGKQ